MELMLSTVIKLRKEYCFNGYIHVKAIPGADPLLIDETGKYVDRMSVNIELPSNQGLKLLAPQKNKDSIIKPMEFIYNRILQTREEKKLFRMHPLFCSCRTNHTADCGCNYGSRSEDSTPVGKPV
jgi:predicted DNA-binding helix-hairpin-helix protein